MIPSLDLPTTPESYPHRRVWLGTKPYWLCQVAGWGCFLATYLVPFPFAVGEPAQSWKAVLVSAATISLSGLFLTHLLRVILLRILARPVSWLRLLSVGATAALVLGNIHTFIGMRVILFSVNAWTHPATPITWNIADYLNSVIISSAVFATWAFIYLAIRVYRHHLDIRLTQLQLESSVRGAELKALKEQLNPHFLFNSLNSLRAMLPLELADARRMVSMLADLLRTTLAFGERPTVHLAQELELAELYLGIEKIRHAARLRWVVRASKELLERPCPPFFVQTLVENAMKHGIDRREAGGLIEIDAENLDGGTRLRVTNPGTLLKERTSSEDGSRGIGLANTRARFELLFGASCRIELRQETPDSVVAEVWWPWVKGDPACER